MPAARDRQSANGKPPPAANDIWQLIDDYLAAGLSVMPADHASKSPRVPGWTAYQTRLPAYDELRSVATGGADGLALICGKVSGGVEVLDFDLQAQAFDEWKEIVDAEAPGLVERLVIQTTQSGGKHVLYRCTEIDGSRKLARLPRDDETVKQTGKDVLVETKGEGGCALIAPSPGYEIIQGDLHDIPVITPDERGILIAAARACDQRAPEPERLPAKANRASGGARPGDVYNQSASHGEVLAMLERAGWRIFRQHGDRTQLTRPGKEAGVSATLFQNGAFHVFTSNADPFQPDATYSPFAVFALLEHGGDYGAASRVLNEIQGGRAAGSAIKRGKNDVVAARTRNEKPFSAVDEWFPFPVHCLPRRLAEYVNLCAESIPCDAAMIAAPLIGAMAGSLGNRAWIRIKRGWEEPCCLYVGVIARSGSAKTPGLQMATAPLDDVLAGEHSAFTLELQNYDLEIKRYDAEVKEWEKRKGVKGDPPSKPKKPKFTRLLHDDVTVEKLVVSLQENPGGILLKRDELSALFKQFNQYKSGSKGGDEEKFLKAWSGQSISVSRKNGSEDFVQRPALSIVGGLQDELAKQLLKGEHIWSGMAARFLWVRPPVRPKRFNDVEIPEESVSFLADVYTRLRTLPLCHEIPEGIPGWDELDAQPMGPFLLSTEARAIFGRYADDHNEVVTSYTGAMSAASAKLEGVAARLACLLHILDAVCEARGPEPHVAPSAMERGIELAKFFLHEAERFYGMLQQNDDQRRLQHLLDDIRAVGPCTPRELKRSRRRWERDFQSLPALLHQLVEAGAIEAHEEDTGGRPAWRYEAGSSADFNSQQLLP